MLFPVHKNPVALVVVLFWRNGLRYGAYPVLIVWENTIRVQRLLSRLPNRTRHNFPLQPPNRASVPLISALLQPHRRSAHRETSAKSATGAYFFTALFGLSQQAGWDTPQILDGDRV